VSEQGLVFCDVRAEERSNRVVEMQDNQRKDSEVRLRIMKYSWLEQGVDVQEASHMVGLSPAVWVLPSTGGDHPVESKQADFRHSLF